MVSVLDAQLFENDVDLFLASPELYPKVTSPKSSLLLMSPGTTYNSSNLTNELSEENAFSFKDNEGLSLSRLNSQSVNDFDLSFVENHPQPEASSQIREISRMSEEALLHMITFVDQAAKAEIMNCDLYNPLEFQSIMPLDMCPDEEGFKITFKDGEHKPEKMEKKLAKMRLLRGHQESFTDHFCRYKDFKNKCQEAWQMLEFKTEDESQEREEKVAQRSKKCKKSSSKNEKKIKNEECKNMKVCQKNDKKSSSKFNAFSKKSSEKELL